MPGTQPTTFNAASTGKGAVLANVDTAGNITIWKIPAQSVIVVSPVPTSPAPSQLYSVRTNLPRLPRWTRNSKIFKKGGGIV